jgi:uncharacterized protein with HEPN domain
VSERDALYLEHVLQAIARIERFTSGGRAAFFSDEMVQSAVVRQLEIVGEAVRNISAELKARETMVPWRNIAGTRDKLIHGYFSVKLDVVWNVVEQELPSLKQHVRRIIDQS